MADRRKKGSRKPAKKRRQGASSRSPSTGKSTRLDRFVSAQQDAVNSFSNFAEQVADMTMRGTYTPSKWVSAYGSMWRDLAKDMARMTRELFKD